MLDNIGLPQRVYNLAFTDGSAIGVNDGVIQIELNEGHEPTADIIKKLRAELRGAFPGRAVLFPARRSGDAGAEFRRADADRRAGAGARPREQQAPRRVAAAADGRRPGHGRCACPAGAGCAGTVLHDRSHARAGAWAEHAGGRQRPQHQPELLRAGFAEFLDRSEKRHSVLFRRADAGIPHRQQEPARQYADRQQPQSRTARRSPTVLGNVATAQAGAVQSVYNHSNIQAVYDVYGSVQDRDLGSVAAAIQQDRRRRLHRSSSPATTSSFAARSKA